MGENSDNILYRVEIIYFCSINLDHLHEAAFVRFVDTPLYPTLYSLDRSLYVERQIVEWGVMAHLLEGGAST
jgi:hypothetical protein